MSGGRKVTEESSPKVPGYIVTFSDMVTLLLTFFVLLISLAQMQDPGLFGRGRESFLESISGFGLGALYGRKHSPDFGHTKVKYFIDSPDKWFEDRSITAREEEIRRIFKKVDRTMKTMPSQIVAKRTNFSVTNIRFSPTGASLNDAAKRFLTQFCIDLQHVPNPKTIRLYVLGLAEEPSSEKERWLLSARRAQAAAEFLESICPSEYKWPIYWWGAGPGGDWAEENSPISRKSQILIAVLRPKD
ncbi:MAG: flagellar motor protein MotB [Planctomycetota bacterium]